LDICVQAQQYFEKYNYSTRVKACCITSVEEAMQIAGVEALTIGQSLVQKLKDSPLDRSAVEKLSLFRKASSSPKLDIQRLDFIDNESRYRDAYARSRGGQGRVKTQRAIDLFCEYQAKAEAIMRAVYTTGSVPDF
jgi:transaldolase